MDKTMTKATSFEEQKADEYGYWQSVSPAERSMAAWQAILSTCGAKEIFEHRPDVCTTLQMPKQYRVRESRQ